MSKLLNELTWMDNETKLEAKKKLVKMKQFLAYPDELLDREKVDEYYNYLEINEDDYFGNVLASYRFDVRNMDLEFRKAIDPEDWRNQRVAVVNAFYSFSDNSMHLPAGILQGIFCFLNHYRIL